MGEVEIGSLGASHPADLPIIWRQDSDVHQYENARIGRVFNHRRPNRFPRAVVEARTEQHIVDAVRLAAKLGCRVAIRSGGHSWAAWSVRDDAILIDLGQYRSIEIDEEKHIAVVSPSTTGQMLNEILSPKGLMFGGGHCPSVGVGGFLLQGGMGWNCRNWGWACEKVQAVDVVTANGDLIHCDESQNQELLWAARGAGPGFPGVVTKFHLELRLKYNGMLSSAFVYPISHYRTVMDWVVKITEGYDEGTEIATISATPNGMSERCIIPLFVTFKQTEAESIAALELANTTRPPGFIAEQVNKPTSIADQYRDQASANPTGHRYCADNAYISNHENVTDVLEKAFVTPPTPKTFSLLYAMNPCSRRKLPDMALSMQSDHYLALYSIWEDERDDERCESWVRDVMKEAERHSDGAYLGDSDFQVRRTRFWADENAKRLMELRRKWDPKGTVCGYLDVGDASRVNGLKNEHEWKALTNPIVS